MIRNRRWTVLLLALLAVGLLASVAWATPAGLVSEEAEQAIEGMLSGGEAFVYITLAALMPLLWAALMVFHFARPYLIRTVRKFTLRFGADVWWLIYVLLRDMVIILTFVLGVFFFFPDKILSMPLPVTGPLATVFLFWALVVKLTRDADDEARHYRWMSLWIFLGAVSYLVPFLFGVEAPMMEAYEGWRDFWTSNLNPGLALPILYLSQILLAATGGYVVRFVILSLPGKLAERKRAAAPTTGD